MRYLIWDEHKKYRSEFLAKNFHFDAISPSDQVLPKDATSILVSGVLRGCGNRIVEAHNRKIPWIYIDNGYLGKDLRVTVSSTAPTKVINDSLRFKTEINLSPWRGGKGEHILILPPSLPYMQTFGANNFLNDVVHGINKNTGRTLMVRAKPPYGSKRAQPSLEGHLKDAYAVITWGSAACIDAVKMGVPTISLGWCPMGPISFSPNDLETDKLNQEPDRMAAIHNLSWFSFDESEVGNAKDDLLDALNLSVKSGPQQKQLLTKL